MLLGPPLVSAEQGPWFEGLVKWTHFSLVLVKQNDLEATAVGSFKSLLPPDSIRQSKLPHSPDCLPLPPPFASIFKFHSAREYLSLSSVFRSFPGLFSLG